MGKVVVVGSFNVDHVWDCQTLPQPGQTLAGRYRSGPGGKGFNQAIAARRAGADTTFLCALGDDAGARLACDLAAADGLDLRHQPCDAPTGTAGIYVDAEGRNSIVLGPGANAALEAAFIDQQADALTRAGVMLTQLETGPAPVLQALQRARQAGATTLLNPAPSNAQTTASMLALTDILTPNETEFVALLARHAPDSGEVAASAVALISSQRLHGLCRRLLPNGTVVVTLGASGCFVSHAEGQHRGDAGPWYRVPADAANAIDTTGAGDAFNGALAAALARAPDTAFGTHIAFAGRYAARSTEREGAAEAMPRLTPGD